MAKDINSKVFENSTRLKLEIFRECFKEWLPVFIHNPFVKKTYIYDFFAGSGRDKNGNAGSPIILLEEAKGENQKYCSKVSNKSIVFGFNEMIKNKREKLENNVKGYLSECIKNCNRNECIYKIGYGNFEFKKVFENEKVSNILSDSAIGKFLLLDQYGFKEVDSDIFLKLIQSPRTDFIFFISSSFIRRFKEHPNITKYFETNRIDFEKSKPHECHKYVANYFRSLVPKEQEFYLHHFTIKKGANYHGLIFGTSHTLGMEKFLKVCWTHDKMSGESNFPMYNDYEPNTLFYTETDTVRLNQFKADLKSKILESKLTNSINAMKYTLFSGVQTSVYLEVVNDLIDSKKVQIEGKLNKKIANIHRLKETDFYKFIIV